MENKQDATYFEEAQFEEVATEVMPDVEFGVRVILFNDDVHTFEEVCNQIVKATGYDADKAMDIARQVNDEGKGVVYEGEMVVCLKVSAILEEIELHTQIEA
jgi:ATP-dependent Clp protease adapter protein ClpS